MDVIALMVAFINATTLALLAVSTVAWSGTTEVTTIYVTVAFLQILVLFGELCSTVRSRARALSCRNEIVMQISSIPSV